jgi:hypothetical protein
MRYEVSDKRSADPLSKVLRTISEGQDEMQYVIVRKKRVLSGSGVCLNLSGEFKGSEP